MYRTTIPGQEAAGDRPLLIQLEQCTHTECNVYTSCVISIAGQLEVPYCEDCFEMLQGIFKELKVNKL